MTHIIVDGVKYVPESAQEADTLQLRDQDGDGIEVEDYGDCLEIYACEASYPDSEGAESVVVHLEREQVAQLARRLISWLAIVKE